MACITLSACARAQQGPASIPMVTTVNYTAQLLVLQPLSAPGHPAAALCVQTAFVLILISSTSHDTTA